MQKQIKIAFEEAWMRMDRIIENHLKPEHSRSEIQKWIREKRIRVNGITITKPAHKMNPDDVVEFTIPELKPPVVIPKNITIEVIYEEDEFLVVHKPVGLTVHPGAGNRQDTLVHALMGMGAELSDCAGSDRPGIVHRLDKETSGLLLVAKTNRMHRLLTDLFQMRKIYKEYRAVVEGHMGRLEDRIDLPIGRHPYHRTKMAVRFDEGGKEAVTDYRVLEEMPRSSLLAVKLITGRTHQIRIHMTEKGHPVLGDPVYGKRKASRLMLHAYQIAFEHPLTCEEMRFTCETEENFNRVVESERLRS